MLKLSELERLAASTRAEAVQMARDAGRAPLEYLAQAEREARAAVTPHERETDAGMAAIYRAIVSLRKAVRIMSVECAYRVIFSWPGREWRGIQRALSADAAIAVARVKAGAPDSATPEIEQEDRPMLECDIIYEAGPAWVHRDKARDRYVVYLAGVTHSTSDSDYPRGADGLSVACARADYLNRRPAGKA